MSSASGVLSLVDDPSRREDIDRVAAAIGVRVVHCSTSQLPSRRAWTAAAAVIVDEGAVERCAEGGMRRRAGVILLARGEAPDRVWRAAISLGTQRVLQLPQQEGELVAALSHAGDGAEAGDRRGVVAVIGARGGAGASIFSAALAIAAGDALLLDADPWGGGLDLLLGIERQAGLRWPDIAVESGRLTFSSVRDAVPYHNGISVLSNTPRGGHITAASLQAMVDAGRRGGVTIVCDLARRLTAAVEAALDAADLVAVVCPCDVRSCASLAAVVPAVTAINPNVGLVVRGPSPGGLRSVEVAEVANLPLLAVMRPQMDLPVKLERKGLRLRGRAPLMAAARRVLAVLDARTHAEAA